MYESYRKTELSEEKAWFWQKNIILTFTTFIFLLHQRLLLPSPCHDQENSFFHFFPTFTTSWSKEKKIIWLLRSLRHNLRVKKYFFHLVTTFNTPWSREKPFFHFGTTFNTTWSQKKKFDFYWITTLTTLPPWKNVIFSFHWDVHYGNIFLHDPASTYYAHYVTNLSKIPKRYTARKKTCAT